MKAKYAVTFALSFFLSLLGMAAYAITTDEVWRNVWDAANSALRVNIVAS